MVLLLVLFLFVPFWATAQSSSVVINEIAWMGSSVDEVAANQHWRYEWLELFNAEDADISLAGWSIELAREELEFVIPLEGVVAPQEYFLVASSDKIPNADVNYANLGGRLVNSGMRVTLKNSIGEVVHEVDAMSGWMGGDNQRKLTMERTSTGWQTSAEAGGSPKRKNSEGFSEPIPETFSFANKKDPSGPFLKESVFSFPVVLALLLALGSGAGILWLRRFLFRRA